LSRGSPENEKELDSTKSQVQTEEGKKEAKRWFGLSRIKTSKSRRGEGKTSSEL
jgi:hypothetical protein